MNEASVQMKPFINRIEKYDENVKSDCNWRKKASTYVKRKFRVSYLFVCFFFASLSLTWLRLQFIWNCINGDRLTFFFFFIIRFSRLFHFDVIRTSQTRRTCRIRLEWNEKRWNKMFSWNVYVQKKRLRMYFMQVISEVNLFPATATLPFQSGNLKSVAE